MNFLYANIYIVFWVLTLWTIYDEDLRSKVKQKLKGSWKCFLF